MGESTNNTQEQARLVQHGKRGKMNPNHRYLLIVNPEAGSRRTMQALPEIDHLLRKRGAKFEFHFTDEPGHATQLVQEIGRDFDVVVSVGGDGTINEILNGMPELDMPLGIIPIGTGNDFARSCSIPVDSVTTAIDILLAHDVKTLDVGEVNGRRFINVMGIGFEGRANDIGQKLSFLKGAPKYIIAIGFTFFSYKRIPMHIEFNDMVLDEDMLLLSIGNGWNVGGGLQLTPKAQLDDGVFDLCVVKNIGKMRIISNFLKLYDGTITDLPEIEQYKTNKILIESDVAIPVHTDGERVLPVPHRFDVSIHPAAQQMIGNWSADKRQLG